MRGSFWLLKTVILVIGMVILFIVRVIVLIGRLILFIGDILVNGRVILAFQSFYLPIKMVIMAERVILINVSSFRQTKVTLYYK